MEGKDDSAPEPGSSPRTPQRRRSSASLESSRSPTAEPHSRTRLTSPTSEPPDPFSPSTPSKRTERIFPISSLVFAPPTPGTTSEPLRTGGSVNSGRRSGSTPRAIEHANPFDGDKLYVNFNEELDRHRQFREAATARYAAVFDNVPPATSTGVLKHPMTMRFQHKETSDGHRVVTVSMISCVYLTTQGLEDFQLTRCEDEPIHIPGAVQGFGVLIAIHEDPESTNLVVRIVSENSGLVLGLSPHYLFSLDSLTQLFNEEQENILRDHIAFCRAERYEPHDLDGPEVFQLTGQSQDSQRGEWTCWVALHIAPQSDLIVLEFELEEDNLFPLATPLDQEYKDQVRSTISVEPNEHTQEDFMESTKNESKPLRLLSRRQTHKNVSSPMEHFSILSQVNEQLAGATDIKQFVKIVVGVFKEITGFHRVMVYQVLPPGDISNCSLTKSGMDKLLQNWSIGQLPKISTAVSIFPQAISLLKPENYTQSTKFVSYMIAINLPLV